MLHKKQFHILHKESKLCMTVPSSKTKFQKWRDDLIFYGHIVQDDDRSISDEERAMRFDRYIALKPKNKRWWMYLIAKSFLLLHLFAMQLLDL